MRDIKKIYFDMDGVLADFNKGLIELCKITPVDQSKATPDDDDVTFNAIRRVDHFYRKLDMVEGVKDLFDTLYDRFGDKCEILTGVPNPKRNIPEASEDKRDWVREKLSDKVVVHTVRRAQKKDYCKGEEYILIDDYQKNIDEWRESGGTGILFKNAKQVLEEIENYMKDFKILYVHGYLGHGNGNASQLLRAEIKRRGLPIELDAPDFPVTDPVSMKETLAKYCGEKKYSCVAASSLGAFYAMQSKFPVRILVNTAMPDDLRLIRDADPDNNERITDGFLKELSCEMDVFMAGEKGADWKDNTYMIFGTKDVTAHGEKIIAPLALESHVFHAEMEHRMAQTGADKVCDILEELIKRSEV